MNLKKQVISQILNIIMPTELFQNNIFDNKTVEARNDAVRPDMKYSSREWMMITISADNES